MKIVWILALLVTIVSSSFIPEPTWENVALDRTIDLSKSYSKELLEIEIKNIDSKPNNEYYLALPNYVFDKLSTFSASTRGKVLSTEIIDELTSVNGEPAINYIKINLPFPIPPKQTFQLTVILAIIDVSEPLPKTLELADTQTLLFKSYKQPISAYSTHSAKLSIGGIADGKELALDGGKISTPAVIKDGQLNYEFDQVDPFTLTVIALLYSHNAPLVRVTELERGIWVSHWGNSLQVEEFYKVTNNAAKLTNGFSRAEFMLNKNTLQSSHAIAALELGLFENAQDVYYTDLVGNVSTSRSFKGKLFIKPRYPVFGGWNYNFTIGWTNKLSEYLGKVSKDEYIVSVPLINGPSDAVYDDVELSFYLPEGSQVLDIQSPLEYETKTEGYELSYFDLNNGHTKVTLNFKDIVDDLSHLNVLVKYKYSTWNYIKKPLDVAKFVLIALISYYALSKIDITLKAKK